MKMPSTLTQLLIIAAVCLHHVEAAAGGGSSMPRPKVSIGVNSDARDHSLGGIEPKVSWASSAKYGDYNLEGGVEMAVADKDSLPFNFWGKAKRSIAGWNLSARVDGDSSDMNSIDLDLRADSGSTALQVTGNANAENVDVQVGSVKLSQKIDALGGSWVLSPRYNVQAKKGDVTVAYGFQDTIVSIDANLDKQKVTIRQNIGDANQVAPSVSTDGKVELEYRRNVLTGTVTTTVKPNEFVGVQWNDGPWQANVKAPLDGGFGSLKDGVQFNIRRIVDV